MLSPRFLAPESYENKVFTKQSEVYSLGCLGFQVFTYGACPFVELDSYGDNTIMDMVSIIIGEKTLLSDIKLTHFVKFTFFVGMEM